MAAKLSERFGYTTEYWLNFGNLGPTGAGALVNGAPLRNGLILPGPALTGSRGAVQGQCWFIVSRFCNASSRRS